MTSSGKRAVAAISIILLLAIIAGVWTFHGPSKPIFTGPAAAPGLLDLLPANAPILAYADLASLRSSSLGPALASFGDPRYLDPDYSKFIKETGFDYTKDLDRVAVAAWPETVTAAKGGSKQETEVKILAVAEGRFDRAKIAAYAQRNGTLKQSGAREIYEISSGKVGANISLTFLADGRIAISQGMPLDSVSSAQDHGTANPEMTKRIERVAGGTFFVVARANDLATASQIPELQTGPMRKSIDSITMLTLAGQPEAKKLTIAVEGQCDSLPHALQLMATLEGVRLLGRVALAGAAKNHQIDAADAATLDSLLAMAKVSRSENYVRVKVELSSEFLQGAAESKAGPTGPAPVSPLHR
jgi:hypothetical protein